MLSGCGYVAEGVVLGLSFPFGIIGSYVCDNGGGWFLAAMLAGWKFGVGTFGCAPDEKSLVVWEII